jgi:hypothetical protein
MPIAYLLAAALTAQTKFGTSVEVRVVTRVSPRPRSLPPRRRRQPKRLSLHRRKFVNAQLSRSPQQVVLPAAAESAFRKSPQGW